jgi:hypothetical protein
MANLSGQGAKAADDFFLEPGRRAERDYARDLGAYSANRGEWSDYYDQVMEADKFKLQGEQFEEQLRANKFEEEAPYAVPRGAGVWDPVQRKMIYQDDTGFGGLTTGEFDRQQARMLYAARNGLKAEQMTEEQNFQAWREWRQGLGLEVLSPVFEEGGPGVTGEYRSNAAGQYRPVQVFPADRGGRIGGLPFETSPPPQPQITAEDIADIDQWASDQKRLARRAYQANVNDFMAPLPGSPEEAAAEEALEAELASIDVEAEQRKERLRSGVIGPGPGEDRVLQYNPATGRAE